MKIDPYLSPLMLMIISDGKEWAQNTRKQPDLVGLSENMQKWENAIFSKSPNSLILKFYGVIHSNHQNIPKDHKARHGTFFFIRITFSSHVFRRPVQRIKHRWRDLIVINQHLTICKTYIFLAIQCLRN